MQKQIYLNLEKVVNEVALRFSNPDRRFNANNETFIVRDIFPLSDQTATVMFEKNTGKVAVAFFYLRKGGDTRNWYYFFPTDTHVLGMTSFAWYKLLAEEINRKHNKEE